MSKEYLYVDQDGELIVSQFNVGAFGLRYPNGAVKSVELIDEWDVTTEGNFIKNPNFQVNTKGWPEYEVKDQMYFNTDEQVLYYTDGKGNSHKLNNKSILDISSGTALILACTAFGISLAVLAFTLFNLN